MEEKLLDIECDSARARALSHLEAFREKCQQWGFPWHEPMWTHLAGERESGERLPAEVRLTWWQGDGDEKLLRIRVTDGALTDLHVFGKSKALPGGFRAHLLALSDFYPAFYWYFH